MTPAGGFGEFDFPPQAAALAAIAAATIGEIVDPFHGIAGYGGNRYSAVD
ncbi:MAG TPA: hypothetical protein VF159_09410 [Gemmatimonadaceae bacterium]